MCVCVCIYVNTYNMYKCVRISLSHTSLFGHYSKKQEPEWSIPVKLSDMESHRKLSQEHKLHIPRKPNAYIRELKRGKEKRGKKKEKRRRNSRDKVSGLQVLCIQHPIIIREQSKVNKTSSHLRNITLTWSYTQAITYITTLPSKSHFLQKRAFGVMPTPHTLKCTRRLEPLDLHAAKRKGKRHEMIAPLQPYGKAWHSTHTW